MTIDFANRREIQLDRQRFLWIAFKIGQSHLTEISSDSDPSLIIDIEMTDTSRDDHGGAGDALLLDRMKLFPKALPTAWV